MLSKLRTVGMAAEAGPWLDARFLPESFSAQTWAMPVARVACALNQAHAGHPYPSGIRWHLRTGEHRSTVLYGEYKLATSSGLLSPSVMDPIVVAWPNRL
jgi:hypothetical protein